MIREGHIRLITLLLVGIIGTVALVYYLPLSSTQPSPEATQDTPADPTLNEASNTNHATQAKVDPTTSEKKKTRSFSRKLMRPRIPDSRVVLLSDVLSNNIPLSASLHWRDDLQDLFLYTAASLHISDQLIRYWPQKQGFLLQRDGAQPMNRRGLEKNQWRWRPANDALGSETQVAREFWLSIPNAFVDIVMDSYLATDKHVVYAPGCLPPAQGSAVRNYARSFRNICPRSPSDSHMKGKKKRAVLLSSGLWSHEYFHMWTETLPHWFSLPKEIRDDQNVLVLVDARVNYVYDALALIGIPSERVVDLHHIMEETRGQDDSKRSEYLCFDELIIPTYPVCGNPSLPQMTLLRNHLELSKRATKPRPKLVIVLDRKGTTRDVINAGEMASALRQSLPKEWHVRLYNVEDIKSMHNIFSKADVIVGHHGAGFVNMIFSPRPLIFEIHDASYMNACYAFMAHILGFPYYGILGRMNSYDVKSLVPMVLEFIEKNGKSF